MESSITDNETQLEMPLEVIRVLMWNTSVCLSERNDTYLQLNLYIVV